MLAVDCRTTHLLIMHEAALGTLTRAKTHSHTCSRRCTVQVHCDGICPVLVVAPPCNSFAPTSEAQRMVFVALEDSFFISGNRKIWHGPGRACIESASTWFHSSVVEAGLFADRRNEGRGGRGALLVPWKVHARSHCVKDLCDPSHLYGSSIFQLTTRAVTLNQLTVIDLPAR